VSRQHLLELHQGPDRRLLDAGHRRAGGGAEPHGDGDHLVVVEQQGRHGRTGAQAIAARRTRERLDRIAELAQPLDVAADRSRRDLEPFREFAARPVAAGLEQGQQREEAAGGGHRPGSSSLKLRTETGLNLV
jgi:hypothetical protein